MLRMYLSPLFLIAFASAALAQPTVAVKADEQSGTPGTLGSYARVQVHITLFLPASKKDQALKAQEQVRRMVYDIASHECTVLRDVIASDCKLQSLNISTQRAPSSGEEKLEVEGFEIQGSINFRIVPKE